MENKYNEGDILSFKVHGELKKGIVWIVDRNGTFEQHEFPSYDIFVRKENMLYKHVTEPEVELVKKSPFVKNRLVSDYTFAKRFVEFLKGIKVSDLPSMEELVYISKVAKDLFEYQVETASDKNECDYLNRLNSIEDLSRIYDVYYVNK